jgi:hypothetical protein
LFARDTWLRRVARGQPVTSLLALAEAKRISDQQAQITEHLKLHKEILDAIRDTQARRDRKPVIPASTQLLPADSPDSP